MFKRLIQVVFLIVFGISADPTIGAAAALDGGEECIFIESEQNGTDPAECECVDKSAQFRVVLTVTGPNNAAAMKIINRFNARSVTATIGNIPCDVDYAEIIANAEALAEEMPIVKMARFGLKAQNANYKLEVVDLRIVKLLQCCVDLIKGIFE